LTIRGGPEILLAMPRRSGDHRGTRMAKMAHPDARRRQRLQVASCLPRAADGPVADAARYRAPLPREAVLARSLTAIASARPPTKPPPGSVHLHAPAAR